MQSQSENEKMSHNRWKLQKALCQYITDTFTYIVAVKDFCEMFSEWKICREKEVEKIRAIKERADEIDPSFSNTEGKEMSSQKPVTTLNINSVAELENVLGEVLKETLVGLEKLYNFLDAVEKLAVTSLQVFTENQILHLPEGISFDKVQDLIKSARLTCPLLLEFKRDAAAFFAPKRHNVEVLLYQLEKHINTSGRIFENLADSKSINISVERTEDIAVECDLSDVDMQNMTDQVKQLDKIRMDNDFRMMFLFQTDSLSTFVKKYNDQLSQLLQFLDKIEECATELDRMNKRAKISSVAGSSVGAVGGMLSIAGLALIPFTAGMSVGLTVAGASLGVTSGVNSLVTTVVESTVNHTQTQQATTAFQSFMDSVQSIQDCLEKVTKQPFAEATQSSEDMIYRDVRNSLKLSAIQKSIVEKTTACGSASACKAYQTSEVVGNAGKVVLQKGKAVRTVSSMAGALPDFGQAAVKAPLALSKGARVGLIGVNALFLGMDLYFITKDGMALAEGTETKVSKFLRARAALWRSEIEAWGKICNSLCCSKLTAEEIREMFERPFYPVGVKLSVLRECVYLFWGVDICKWWKYFFRSQNSSQPDSTLTQTDWGWNLDNAPDGSSVQKLNNLSDNTHSSSMYPCDEVNIRQRHRDV